MDLMTIAMICLGLYLILEGASRLLKLSFESMPIVLGLLALIAGVIIIIASV